MRYKINKENIELKIEGERKYGESKILLNYDDDLSASTCWKEKGYSIQKLFSQKE